MLVDVTNDESVLIAQALEYLCLQIARSHDVREEQVEFVELVWRRWDSLVKRSQPLPPEVLADALQDPIPMEPAHPRLLSSTRIKTK